MESIYGTWPWYVSGFLIGSVMLALIYFGKTFGMSSNLRTMCTMLGAGKTTEFFRFDWKSQRWNLVVVLGAMLGGYIAVHFLSDPSVPTVQVNPQTVTELHMMHIDAPNDNGNGKLLPDALTSAEALQSPKILGILLLGGLLVGFGTRYAGGCTSGHAITGLSNLQLPSLIAVIGFFIGGLIMSWLLLPLFFN
ncbi:YeeE/YedE thiosulfate transporter family protein [Flavobacterium sp. DG1-102-2]|uniref:YeeE/YedE family protein n=1 Tax=Flavobacterium sp. DG1-102-2 TaxID=3081663 RepID=UPI00294A5F18|nr:YeeE/YedE thiosulfate transporter family protein [Flavobacterium sp. DG1-102-2]MDV6168156.1 YeeE/YedE thiosulfate transporter family protein [Flavobacterium sp. DG1-102-2]